MSALKVRTMPCNSSTLNLPTDDTVVAAVLSDLEGKGLNILLLKERIKKYERMVQKYLDSGEEIVENKDLLLRVFKNLRPIKTRAKLIQLILPPSSSSEKRSRDEHDDSAYLGHAKKANSESVEKQSTRLGSAQKEIEKSAVVMEDVSKKLGEHFSGDLRNLGNTSHGTNFVMVSTW